MSNSSGDAGEGYAADYLRRHGFDIVKRNFYSRFGEIDIIAQDSRYLVFVEVKTRERGSFLYPLEAITRSKQKKIISTACLYLQLHPTTLQPRFDAAAVTAENGVPVSVSYFANAFSCRGFF